MSDTIEQSISKPLFSKKDLVSLLLPLAAEQLLAMLIGLCDTFMVASIGEDVVSGVSLIDQFSQLMIQLFAAFTTGGAVISSQYLGQRSTQNACKAAKQLLNLAVLAGLFIVIFFLPLRYQILKILYGKIDPNVMENAVNYFVYICLSMPFLGIYNSCAALYRSMGNSKLSLKISTLMNGLNILGNSLFIFVLKMGVHGAGLATLLSRLTASLVMCAMLTKKTNRIYIDRIFKLEWRQDMVRRILRIGVPSGIENSVFHIGKILVQSFMSTFGTAAIAANAICNTLASFANVPGQTIGLGSITVVGQCIGAGEKKQAKNYGKMLITLTYICMSILAILIFIFANQIISTFNLSPVADHLAVGIIRTCMIGNMVLWPMTFTMPNILRAAGDAKFTMIVSNISMWAFRVCLSYLFSIILLRRFPDAPHLALYGVWFGMYADWICRSTCFFTRFIKGKWLDAGKSLLK